MIKLKYKTINDSEFTMALEKLSQCEEFPIKVAYNIGKIRDKVKKELETAHPLFMNLIKKFAVLEENGEIKQTPGRGYEIPKEKQAEFDKEWEDFMALEITIDRFPVMAFDLETAMSKVNPDRGEKLSGKELAALEPILDMESALVEAS